MAYRLHMKRTGPNREYGWYTLTVPARVAALIPEGMEFMVEVDSKGIHYLPVDSDVAINRPDWAKPPEEEEDDRGEDGM